MKKRIFQQTSQIILLAILITNVKCIYKYQISLYIDNDVYKQYSVSTIDLQTEEKGLETTTVSSNIFPMDQYNGNIDLQSLEVVVQVQQYETGQFDILNVTNTKKFDGENECQFQVVQQDGTSKLPNLSKNYQIFIYQKAKTYAFFQDDLSTLYLILILYDSYQDREIFITNDFNVYYMNISQQKLKFEQMKISMMECDQLSKYIGMYNDPQEFEDDEDFNRQKKNQKVKRELFHKRCEQQEDHFVEMDLLEFDQIGIIVFNMLNEPLESQSNFRQDVQDPVNKMDESLNIINYSSQSPKDQQVSAIFMVVTITKTFKYHLYQYNCGNIKVIAISEMLPKNSLLGTQIQKKMYHYILFFKIIIDTQNPSEKSQLFIDIYDMSISEIIFSQVFWVDNVKQTQLIQILFDIKGENHNILFDNSEESRQKKQFYFIQTQFKKPKNIKLSFSHYQYRKIKLFGDVTKVDIYQLNFHCFFLPDAQKPLKELFEGKLSYLSCRDVADLSNSQYTQIQRRQCALYLLPEPKKIVTIDISGVQCSTSVRSFDNILYEMYLVDRISERKKNEISDIIKVDRRYSDFTDFYFIHTFKIDKSKTKCTINIIEDRIIVNFFKSSYDNSLQLSLERQQLTVQIGPYSCETQVSIQHRNIEDSILDQKITFQIHKFSLKKKYILQNYYLADFQKIFVPFIISNPKEKIQNADKFYQNPINVSIINNYLKYITLQQNPLTCLTSLDKEYVFIDIKNSFQNQTEIEADINQFILIDIDDILKKIVMRYQDKQIQIQIEDYLEIIKKHNFKKLHFHVYFDNEEQNQNNLSKYKIVLNLTQRINKNFMIFNFDLQYQDNVADMFQSQKLYFFHTLQKKYNFIKQSQIGEFSEFDSESQSFSQIEEINGDIFDLKLTKNHALRNQALLHYEMQIDSSKFLFKKQVLSNKSAINKSELQGKNFFSLYDMMFDSEMKNYEDMYCASTLIDIDLTCPVNIKSFEFIQINQSDDIYIQNGSFDDKIGYVFSLIAPSGQLFVMDYIYKNPRENVVQNCVALIFTQTSLYVSSTTSNLDLKLLYSYYGISKFNNVKKLIYRTIIDGSKESANLQNFVEDMKIGVKLHFGIKVFNSGDTGGTSVISKLQRNFKSKIQKHQQLSLESEGQDEQQEIYVEKIIKLTKEENDRIETLIDQKAESNNQQEIVIKVVPIVFTIVNQSQSQQQRKNNILKYKKEKSQINFSKQRNFSIYNINLGMHIDSFQQQYLVVDDMSTQKVDEYQTKAEKNRQENLTNIKQHYQDKGNPVSPEVLQNIEQLFQQQREFDNHFYGEFGE